MDISGKASVPLRELAIDDYIIAVNNDGVYVVGKIRKIENNQVYFGDKRGSVFVLQQGWVFYRG